MESGELILFGLAGALTLVGVLVVSYFLRAERARTKLPAPVSTLQSVTPELASASPQSSIEVPLSLREALANTEKTLWGRLRDRLSGQSATTAKQVLEEVEEILYTSDLGPQTVERVMGALRTDLTREQLGNIDLVKGLLRQQFSEIFKGSGVAEPGTTLFSQLKLQSSPAVWLIVGVNGAGKTTSIGKLAAGLASEGKKVLVAAGDTFRAAAEAQLQVWTDRAQVEIFSPPQVKDPSAVAFDAIAKAVAQKYDVVLIDTAGRLHTQANLMEELKKLKRVISKAMVGAPHETLIVLDGNSGQNALLQAREFHGAIGLTGVVLTKMDGTAKGGVAVGLAHELKIPIRLIGVGEKLGDLRPFSSTEFVASIL